MRGVSSSLLHTYVLKFVIISYEIVVHTWLKPTTQPLNGPPINKHTAFDVNGLSEIRVLWDEDVWLLTDLGELGD